MSNGPIITAIKIGGVQQVSFETLLSGGAISEEQAREMGWKPTPRTPVSRRKRLRWALASWWYEHKPRVHLGPCDHGDCA